MSDVAKYVPILLSFAACARGMGGGPEHPSSLDSASAEREPCAVSLSGRELTVLKSRGDTEPRRLSLSAAEAECGLTAAARDEFMKAGGTWLQFAGSAEKHGEAFTLRDPSGRTISQVPSEEVRVQDDAVWVRANPSAAGPSRSPSSSVSSEQPDGDGIAGAIAASSETTGEPGTECVGFVKISCPPNKRRFLSFCFALRSCGE